MNVYKHDPHSMVTRQAYEKFKYSVLAQIEDELGDPDVEKALYRLASWNEHQFAENLTVVCINQGYGFMEGSFPMFLQSGPYDDLLATDWAVF